VLGELNKIIYMEREKFKQQEPKIEPFMIAALVHIQMQEIFRQINRKEFMDNMNA